MKFADQAHKVIDVRPFVGARFPRAEIKKFPPGEWSGGGASKRKTAPPLICAAAVSVFA
jgi:hypothetical protein